MKLMSVFKKFDFDFMMSTIGHLTLTINEYQIDTKLYEVYYSLRPGKASIKYQIILWTLSVNRISLSVTFSVI